MNDQHSLFDEVMLLSRNECGSVKDNTLLHKDKDLSTNQLFYKSVPDDKHSNTQYIKQEYNSNNCSKLKYTLLSKTVQHANSGK